MKRILACLVMTIAVAVQVQTARAAEALVAVAANFAETIEALKPHFETASGHTFTATTGATGKLYAQITEGAPFDVFLSADAKTPARLEEEGKAVKGTRFTYASGQVALWSATDGRIGGDGAKALAEGNLRHIAIANPELAPYGVAAREAMEKLGVWDKVSDRIVMGQNIGQTHSMVATGAAEAGFVALSALTGKNAVAPESYWIVPQELYSPLIQDAVLLAHGESNEAAQALVTFLASDEAKQVIRSFGYHVE